MVGQHLEVRSSTRYPLSLCSFCAHSAYFAGVGSFSGLVGNWIDSDWVMHTSLLACRQMTGPACPLQTGSGSRVCVRTYSCTKSTVSARRCTVCVCVIHLTLHSHHPIMFIANVLFSFITPLHNHYPITFHTLLFLRLPVVITHLLPRFAHWTCSECAVRCHNRRAGSRWKDCRKDNRCRFCCSAQRIVWTRFFATYTPYLNRLQLCVVGL
jgi:hypothetical protein